MPYWKVGSAPAGGISSGQSLFAGASSGVFTNQQGSEQGASQAGLGGSRAGLTLQKSNPAAAVGKSSLNVASPMGSIRQSLDQQGTMIGGLLGGILPEGAPRDVGRWIGDNILSAPFNAFDFVVDGLPANPMIPMYSNPARLLAEAPDSPEKRAYMEKIKADPWRSMELINAFAREYWQKEVESGRINPMLRDFGPTENMGDQVDQILATLPLLSNVIQRTVSGGVGGDGRVEEFEARVAGAFGNVEASRVPEHIRPLYAKFKSGEWSKDRFLDELTMIGAGYSDDQFTNLLISMVADPLILGSFVGGIGLKVAANVEARMAVSFTKALAKPVYDDLLEAATAGLKQAEGIAPSVVRPQNNNVLVMMEAQKRGGFASELAAARADAGIGAVEGAVTTMRRNPALSPIFDIVQKINNPLEFFGKDNASRFSNAYLSQYSTKGMIHAFGATEVETTLRAVEGMGLGANVLQHGLGIFGANMSRVWSTRRIAGQILRIKKVLRMTPNEAVDAQLSGMGSSVERHMEEFVTEVMPKYYGDEALARGREQAALRLGQMYGRSASDFTEMASTMSARQLALVDGAYFGYAIQAFTKAKKTGMAVMTKTDFPMDRLNIVGPRNLTKARAKVVLDAVEAGDANAVREYVRSFEELTFNFAANALSDEALLKAVGGYLRGLGDNVTETLSETGDDLRKLVGDDVAAWAEEFRLAGYELGFAPEADDIWRLIKDPDTGEIVGVNPWIDWVDDVSATWRPGNLERVKSAIFRQVRGERIHAEAKERFIRIALKEPKLGLAQADAEAIFYAISNAANEMGVMPRGLSGTRMWEAVRSIRLPEATRDAIGAREIAGMITRAYEGHVGTVGVTQKISGVLKTEASGFGNVVGQIAEHYYPMARFTMNAWFQLQEFTEPFILATMRGVKPGVKLSELDKETLTIVDNLLKEGRHMKFDQAEFADVLLWGSHEAKKNFGATTRMGKLAERIIPPHVREKGGLSVWEAKQVAYAGQIRKVMGDEFYLAMSKMNPEFYAELQRFYGTTDRGMIAMRYLNEIGGAHAKPGEYAKILADITKPADFGARVPVDLPFLRRVLGKDTLQEMIADARAGRLSRQDIHDALWPYGATDDYVTRIHHVMTGPTVKEFREGLQAAFPKYKRKDIDALMSVQEAIAAHKGVSLEEHLATTFEAAPKYLNSAGRVPAGAFYQTAHDTFVARGLKIEPIDSPRVQNVRDLMDDYVPQGETVDFGVGGKGRGSAIAHQRIMAPGGREQLAPKTKVAAVTDKGGLRHTIGRVSIPQWVEQITNVLGEQTAREAGLWYHEMATTFLALTDTMSVADLRLILGDKFDEILGRAAGEFTAEQAIRQEAAAKLLVSWGLSQLNTSPSDGWGNLLRLMDEMRYGARPGMKGAGLQSVNLKRILEEGERASQFKVGEKLFDFLDSIRLARVRNYKKGLGDVRGPAAGDIWAARDVGFVDQTTLVRYAKEKGLSVEEAAAELGVLSRKDKRVLDAVEYVDKKGKPRTKYVLNQKKYDDLVKEEGLQPVFTSVSDNMYEYIVQYYNDAADYLNREKFLGRTDWTPADAQAVGWVRAQKAMGIQSDNPDSIFAMNARQVSYEIKAGSGSRYAEVFPEWDTLTYEQQVNIMDDFNSYLVPKIEEMTGAKVLSQVKGEGTWQGERTRNVTLEIMGTDDQIQDAIDTIAYLAQQNAVYASRTTGAKAGGAWAVDFIPPTVLTDDEMVELVQMADAHIPIVKNGGSQIVVYEDGRKGIRSMWFADKQSATEFDFKQAHPDSDFDEFIRLATEKHGTPEAGIMARRRVVSSLAAAGDFDGNNFVGSDNGERLLASLARRGRSPAAAQLDGHAGFEAHAVLEDAYLRRAPDAYTAKRAALDAARDAAGDTEFSRAESIAARDPKLVAARDTLGRLQREYDRLDPDSPAAAAARPALRAAAADYMRARLGSMEEILFQTVDEPDWDKVIPTYVHNQAPDFIGKQVKTPLGGYRTPFEGPMTIVDDGEELVTHGVEMWYDKNIRSWTVHYVDDQGNALGEAINVYSKAEATTEVQRLVNRVAVEGAAVADTPTQPRVMKGAYPEMRYSEAPRDIAPNQQFHSSKDITPQEEQWYLDYRTARAEDLCDGIGFSSYVGEFTGCQAPRGHAGTHMWHHARGSTVKIERWSESATYEQYLKFMEEQGIRLQRATGATPGKIRGATKFAADGRATIYGTSLHNRTTALHEMAHVMERDLDPSMRNLVVDEFNKATGGNATQWGRNQSEWFADQFNQYLATRSAPNPRLKAAFDYFALWLKRTLGIKKASPGGVSDEMAALYDDLLTPMKVDDAKPHDFEQQMYYSAAYTSLERAEEEAYQTQYFKRGRSWLERSVNHPYLGYYPASYYWGKILPEMTRFLMMTPFGIPAPGGGLMVANKVWESVVVQKETDPEFRNFMESNEAAFRTISMLVPATPWDISVNAALPYRRLAQADLENRAREAQGKDPLTPDYGKIAHDVAGYINPITNVTDVASRLIGYGGDSVTMLSGTMDEAMRDLNAVFVAQQ